MITRGEAGGAQVHVRDLVAGLRHRLDFHVAVGEAGFLTDELDRLDVPCTVLPTLRREVAPRQDAHALRSLGGLIGALSPDMVHTHSTKAGLLGRLAAHRAGVPAVHTAHSWAFSDGIRRRRKAVAVPLEVLAARASTRIIAVSHADRALASRFFVAGPDKVRVVHNGVPDVGDQARPGAPGVPVLVMVARMAAPKDHGLLLRALAQVTAPWRLQLVGDGPLRPQVEAEVQRLGLGDRVELLGVRHDVPALLAGAHVGVLVSRQEGFPLVVLEAMRAGLPVVASDVGGVREAVSDGRTGRLVARDDSVGLAAALDELCRSPTLRRDLGAAGRAAYLGGFTVAHMVAGTAAVYTQVAEAHGLAPLAPDA